ncbi:MAG TPA: hypothetical protein VF598_06175 [Hymenobacter sp.]
MQEPLPGNMETPQQTTPALLNQVLAAKAATHAPLMPPATCRNRRPLPSNQPAP